MNKKIQDETMLSSQCSTKAAKQSINNEDLLALQAYVTASDSTQYSLLAANTVLIDLTHSNLKQRHIEQRFDLSCTIDDVRMKIHQKTGTPPSDQHLQIRNDFDAIVAEIPPNSHDRTKIGYFSIEHGWNVHCIDTNPYSTSRNGSLENTDLVPKYRMSEEDYDAREGTLRDWARKQREYDATFTLAKHARERRELSEVQRQAKLGLELPKGWEYDEVTGKPVRVQDFQEENEHSEQQPQSNATSCPSDGGPETVQGFQIGQRCEVQPGGRRGHVAFVGEVVELSGFWVGVVFDEPVGKADGSVKGGKRYFEARPGHGGFLRGKNVQVGDFPERDIFLDDSSEDEI
jgi:tubulin-folding cofactor B